MVEKDSPVIFSDWLKRRRKALDITQEELAERAGCSVGALRKIESGDRRPSKQLAGLLAKSLEIPNEDQQTFIRVARGELNLERLGRLSPEPIPAYSDGWKPRQAQPREPLETRPAPASNRLPSQATPLVGRDTELSALERLFVGSQCRLLTLTGVGGIGKTRLAIEFAAKIASAFPGGVFYVPLTPVNSPDKIIPAIGDVLDFGFSGPTEPKEQLLNYISSHIKQKALFILDNLEHLLVQGHLQEDQFGVADLVSEILQRLPNLSILGTSRERLNIHDEWTYELHGLSVPPTNFAGKLEAYNAVALFVNSAQRTNADFQLTAEEQYSLIRICQLVEGVPLAIELAAAWVSLLSCREIAQEIQSNMDFLTTSLRDIPERHRSIRAAFDHSWKLLTDEERWALCQLSVFHGGFNRDAAYQVAGASLPLLASLSAKSLVRRADSGRYDLHEVIRQFALSHLNHQPQYLSTYERHCEYYLSFMGEREKSLKCSLQQEAIRRLTDDIDNIRAAWAWAIEHKKFDQLGQAGRAFGWYFEIAGLLQEGIEQLELLAQAVRGEPQNEARRRVLGLALIHQALLSFRKGEFIHALRLYEESIDILRPTGDQILLADALAYLGTMLHLTGKYDRAKSTLEEALILAQNNREPWIEAWAIYNLGHLAGLIGCYGEGYEQMRAGLAMWRTIGDPFAIALGLNFMVPTLIKLRRYEEAKTFMQENIALCEQTKNRWGMGTAYRFLGLATLAAGQSSEAEAHFRKSLEIFGEYHVGWDIARTLTYLGDAKLLSGDFIEARKAYVGALSTAVEENAIPIALDALSGLGSLHTRAGKAGLALALCYYILDHPSSEAETKHQSDVLRAFLESKLSIEQLAAARAMAGEKSLGEMVKTALEDQAAGFSS